MKKKYILVSILTLLSAALMSLSTAININLKNQNHYFSVEQKAPNKKIILDVKKANQETSYYCVPAVLQVVFDFFGFHYEQNYIYQQLQGSGANGITLENDNINWINNELEAHHRDNRYYRSDIPMGFGESSHDQFMFQSFVVSSLTQGVPVIMATRNGIMAAHHATVIYGIEVNEENPEETIYHYRDPMFYSDGVSFEANELSGFFCRYPALVLGANSNFDFINRKITVSTSDQAFSGTIQNQTIEKNQATDLTKEAGIINLSQLQKVKTVQLSDFNVKINWFDKSYLYNDESWQTKWFINGQSEFTKYNPYSWFSKYRNVARGHFDTFYSSSTWKEADGAFYLNLSYRFFAKTLLTSTLIYAEIVLGSKWTLSF